MPAIEAGRICVKKVGREAGKRCVIVDLMDKNFALVTGPKELTGVRRRRVNVEHLELTDRKVDVEKGATDEELLKAVKKGKLEDFLKSEVKLETA